MSVILQARGLCKIYRTSSGDVRALKGVELQREGKHLHAPEAGRQKPDEAFFEEVTQTLGIRGKLRKYPGELSGGEQQESRHRVVSKFRSNRKLYAYDLETHKALCQPFFGTGLVICPQGGRLYITVTGDGQTALYRIQTGSAEG